ncbi:MAG TPA: ABC transporter ATP-binding protein [Thermoanaerobaculia bacterium]|nr:ABC transporter ATP-binding protein [Thermoanaerobaculia bacterium]
MKDSARFLSYFARRPGAYAAGFGTMALSAALFLAMPRIVRYVLESLETDPSPRRIALACGAILLLGAADAVLFFFTRRILIGASRDVEFEMREDLFAHLLRLPPRWHRKSRVGDVMSRAVNDLSAVRMMIGPGIMQAANTLVVGSIALTLMAFASPSLTLVALGVLPFVVVATQGMGKVTHRRFTAIQEFFSEISASAQENFNGARLVRAFAREATEEARFDAKNRELRRRNLRLARLNALYFPLLQALVGSGFAIILWVGGRQILAGELTVARYVEFNLYLMELVWPAIALGWVVNLWQRGTASWNRMAELWAAEPLPEESGEGPLPNGPLEAKGLTFGYDGGPPVLRDVAFTVEPGTTVAVVGRTGSGKSTLLQLLLRLEEPPFGTIRLGGRDLREVPLPLLRRTLVAVPQETFLFSDTLAANVAMGRPGATRAEVERAALEAGLGPDLATFPKGLDTIVGERGITLSGGQKQRTALARALLADAPFLVLDDAFSAVDTETEEKILEAVKARSGTRTIFLVSHRLSTIQHADFVVVLEKGRVVETGTHEELLRAGGLYAELAERQRLSEEVEAA